MKTVIVWLVLVGLMVIVWQCVGGGKEEERSEPKAGGPVFKVGDQASTIASANAVFDWLESEHRAAFVGVIASQMPLLETLKGLSGKTGAEIVALAKTANADDGSAVLQGMMAGGDGDDAKLRQVMESYIRNMFYMKQVVPEMLRRHGQSLPRGRGQGQPQQP